jgi:hypothetical protein
VCAGFLGGICSVSSTFRCFLGVSDLEDATDFCGVLSKTLGKCFFLKKQFKSKTNKRRCCCYCNFYFSASCINQTPPKLTINNKRSDISQSQHREKRHTNLIKPSQKNQAK